MPNLTRPEGAMPEDLLLSRRSALAGAVFGGYALYAFSAQASPIHTDAAGLVTETAMLAAPDRMIPAFLARPEGAGRFPAIIVVSEVFGVHEYIRDICRRLARLGYVAIAPDFFIRSGDPSTLTDFGEIRRIVSQASEQQVMDDLAAALTFLKRARFVERRQIGVTGFCWGGAVTWAACATFPEIKAGVAWYGRLARPAQGEFLGGAERRWPVEFAGELKSPVLGLYAGKDQGIPLTDVEAMRQALQSAGKSPGSQIVVYPQSQHGFHADYRASYDPDAAFDGWMRMRAHFEKAGLKPRPVSVTPAG